MLQKLAQTRSVIRVIFTLVKLAANHVASRGDVICYVTHDVMHAKAEIISICPAHFLAENFAICCN